MHLISTVRGGPKMLALAVVVVASGCTCGVSHVGSDAGPLDGPTSDGAGMDGHPGDGHVPAGVTPDDVRAWADALRRAYCEGLLENCAYTLLQWASVEQCAAHDPLIAPLGATRFDDLVERAAAGELEYDAAAANACLAYLRDRCPTDSALETVGARGACARAFHARASATGFCDTSMSCARDEACSRPHGSLECTGAQRCLPVGGRGDTCRLQADCTWREMLYCAPDGAGIYRCLPFDVIEGRGAGEPCGFLYVENNVAYGGRCADGHSCGLFRRCERAVGVGEDCRDPDVHCAIGSSCGEDRTCTDRAVATDGAPCDESCVLQAGLVCDLGTGLCTATDGAEGSACDLGSGCQAGLACFEGVCRPREVDERLGTDEPCEIDSQCASRCCSDERCIDLMEAD